MKVAKFREMTDADLRDQERKLAEQLFKLRVLRAGGQLDNPMKSRNVRRDIARIKTIMTERGGKPGAGRNA